MADIEKTYDLLGSIAIADGSPYTIVDPIVTPDSHNPVQSKGIYDFVISKLHEAVDEEARQDISDIMVEINNLDIKIDSKMEFYKIDYIAGTLSHKGVTLTYNDIISKYNDTKYFIYVEGDGYTYIPTLPPLEGDEIIEFVSSYIYGGNTYMARIIINSSNEIKQEEVKIVRDDQAVKTVNNIAPDSNGNINVPTGGGDVTKAYVDEQDNAIRTNVTMLDEQINGGAVILVIIDGEYSRSSDGRIVSYAGWSRTDYTDVGGIITLNYSYTGADSRYNCFYDENKTFITSFNITATESGFITVPSNAKYFVVSTTTEDISSFRWLNGKSRGIADEVTTIIEEIDSLEKIEIKDLQVSSLIGLTGSNRETIIGNHIYYHLGFSARQAIPAGTILFTGTPHKLDSKNFAWTTYLGDVATFDFNKNGTITNALPIAQGKAFFIDFVVC